MFDKILIANRGEIAVRVMRTARALGVRSVAVYSEADAHAAHVDMADEAVLLGPAPAAQSYLAIDKVIRAARKTGAQAIHPGYGFLSERADFAEACAAAGLVFIGPPADAIRAMGSKAQSKRLMERANVPMVPGYHGADQSDATLTQAAARIGWPILVKASAGGGGKGMRVVHGPDELAGAIGAARREAQAAFGDDSLLLERYLTRPRHVEIQVFCDRHGHGIYLFDRDCSLQRRHQKVIEEAPAPMLDDDLRARMGAAALAAAQAVGYVGAGTVEFLVEGGEFFFIEMNTRLQVEHPVTEMITGQDLVEWQLRVAAGLPLPLAQHELRRTGHAVEARLYAEDPDRDFLPATGTLTRLTFPAASRHVRIDSGVRQGDRVGAHYDPMLAKLIVWDHDRPAALARLARALTELRIAGPTTNAGFLATIATHPAFVDFQVDTGFIERHRAQLLPGPTAAPARVLALAAAGLLLDRGNRAVTGADPHSPWRLTTGWRLNDDNHHDFRLIDAIGLRQVCVHFRPQGWDMEIEGQRLAVRSARLTDGVLSAEIDGHRVPAGVTIPGAQVVVQEDGRTWTLAIDDPAARAELQDTGDGARLTAPMAGTVVQVLVQAGQPVIKGQALVVVEAMKMEHAIKAPGDGTVTAIAFAVGDTVQDGDLLVDFTPQAAEAAP